MALELSDVLEDPAGACRVLEAKLFGVQVDRLVTPAAGGVVLEMTFAPLPELVSAGYTSERGRIGVRPGGWVYAFPLGAPRTWKHRELSPLGGAYGYLGGDLCLFYPRDSRSLRWEWGDGFEQYVTRVHRHLFFEEYYRREGHWPVEDAPHGEPATGSHPVESAFMTREGRRWAS